MKIRFNLFLAFIAAIQICNGQTTPAKEFHDKDFNWTILIPENFQTVSTEEWTKMQNRGAEAIEDTFGEEIINQAKTIFVFRSNQFNYFEANYQPFDPEVDGDYIESCKNVNALIYETFATQIPDAKIDTASSVEKIGKLEFQTHTMKIVLPNKMVMHQIMYSRLFGKREFSVNIMFVDPKKGQQMLDAWKNSRFSD